MIVARTSSVDATRELGASLASCLVEGDVLLLSGDLGAGKTAFVQGLGRGLLVADRITSPTFTIVSRYEGRMTLHHVDAYRLTSGSEVLELALSEILDEGGVMAVEWGDAVRGELPGDRLELRLRLGEGDDDRRIEIDGVGPSWQRRRIDLRAALVPWTMEPDQ